MRGAYSPPHKDSLTGLGDLRALEARLDQEVSRCAALPAAFALMTLAIDRFRWIDEHLGRSTGKEVLKQIGSLLLVSAAPVDLVARHGGAQFAWLHLQRKDESLPAACRRLIRGLHAIDWRQVHPDLSGVSASIGVALWRPGLSVRQMMQGADRCLYQAQLCGGDRALMQ